MKWALLIILQCLFGIPNYAQYKNFELTIKGDTINAIDKSNLKQGKWVIHVAELRGEPGYEEEGIFINGKKEGLWRQYNLTGDIIAVEYYKLGGKDGVQQYYNYLGDLLREESWRAYNPDAPYDTIAVYGEGNNEIIDYKIVKAETYSVRHGDWKYFEEGTGRLIKTEQYNRGHLETPESKVTTAAPTTVVTEKTKKPAKTAEMLEWEKKNKGKKKVLRDGKTGM